MSAHDEIIDLLKKINTEQDPNKLRVLVMRLHRLVAQETERLEVLIASKNAA